MFWILLVVKLLSEIFILRLLYCTYENTWYKEKGTRFHKYNKWIRWWYLFQIVCSIPFIISIGGILSAIITIIITWITVLLIMKYFKLDISIRLSKEYKAYRRNLNNWICFTLQKTSEWDVIGCQKQCETCKKLQKEGKDQYHLYI